MPLNGENFKSKSTNVSQEACTDIRGTRFLTRCEKAFFNVRVFTWTLPHITPQVWKTSLSSMSSGSSWNTMSGW